MSEDTVKVWYYQVSCTVLDLDVLDTLKQCSMFFDLYEFHLEALSLTFAIRTAGRDVH